MSGVKREETAIVKRETLSQLDDTQHKTDDRTLPRTSSDVDDELNVDSAAVSADDDVKLETVRLKPGEIAASAELKRETDTSNDVVAETNSVLISPQSKSADDAADVGEIELLETDALKDVAETNAISSSSSSSTVCRRVANAVSRPVAGWRTYARQSVVFAGLSLALLYMTVLGFDGITVGQSV